MSYILLNKNEIEEIKKIDKKGQVGRLNFEFTKSDKYKINRTSSAKGLAVDIETNEVLPYYPHLVNHGTLPDDFYTQPKYNGTNIGLLLHKNIIRTRGSINQLKFVNSVNMDILTDKQYIGIPSEIWNKFVEKYKPILQEGIKDGFVDQFGYFDMSKIVDCLTACKFNILERYSSRCPDKGNVIAVFGELISKYNPIPVDRELKYGMYNCDWNYMVFDILIESNNGYEFLNPKQVKELADNLGTHIKSVPYNHNKFIEFPNEEGVIVKSDYYYKVKIDEVLEYEREMGRLSNIITYSIRKVFSETGFHLEDLNNGIFNKDGLKNIIQSVEEEIKDNGISIDSLVEYYKKLNRDYYRVVKNLVEENAVFVIADILFDIGTPKETLYLDIPKYISLNKPVEYNEKRKKYLPSMWYGKMVSRTIGKIINR